MPGERSERVQFCTQSLVVGSFLLCHSSSSYQGSNHSGTSSTLHPLLPAQNFFTVAGPKSSPMSPIVAIQRQGYGGTVQLTPARSSYFFDSSFLKVGWKQDFVNVPPYCFCLFQPLLIPTSPEDPHGRS